MFLHSTDSSATPIDSAAHSPADRPQEQAGGDLDVQDASADGLQFCVKKGPILERVAG